MRVCAAVVGLAACSFSAPSAPAKDAGPRTLIDASIADAADPPDGFEIVSLLFRDGEAYSGTRDNWLIAEITDSRGSRDSFNWDQKHTEGLFGDNKGESVALLKFEIFGSGADQVPRGSMISRAVMIVVVFDGAGEPTTMYDVSIPWDESSTWETFGAAPGPVPGDDYDEVTAVPFETEQNGAIAIDVSASVSRWSAGAPNHGWLFRAGSENGTDVRSREHDQEAERPTLLVDYLVPASL